jgi:hypothetical protein
MTAEAAEVRFFHPLDTLMRWAELLSPPVMALRLLILFKRSERLFGDFHSCAFGDNNRNVVCLVAGAERTDVARNG